MKRVKIPILVFDNAKTIRVWHAFFISLAENSVKEATTFAWENRMPFLVRALLARPTEHKAVTSERFLNIEPQNVVLVNMRPVKKENAVVLQLREITGKSCQMSLMR